MRLNAPLGLRQQSSSTQHLTPLLLRNYQKWRHQKSVSTNSENWILSYPKFYNLLLLPKGSLLSLILSGLGDTTRFSPQPRLLHQSHSHTYCPAQNWTVTLQWPPQTRTSFSQLSMHTPSRRSQFLGRPHSRLSACFLSRVDLRFSAITCRLLSLLTILSDRLHQWLHWAVGHVILKQWVFAYACILTYRVDKRRHSTLSFQFRTSTSCYTFWGFGLV